MTMLTANSVEISGENLIHNVQLFRSLLGPGRKLLIVVKSNAYGHGMIETARLAILGGADWLGVYSFEEGFQLREAGIQSPVLVMGYVPSGCIAETISYGLSLGVSSLEVLELVAAAARRTGKKARVHLKLETGLNRLGIHRRDLSRAEAIIADQEHVMLEGLYTHYANIEDTVRHEFARLQRMRFSRMCARFMSGEREVIRHTACTAAALLFPSTYFEMVRVGIGTYGMWPSRETLITALETKKDLLDLRPVLTWKSHIAQVKNIRPGETIGYGRSYRVTRPTRIAVIPVGYADGYDRRLSGKGYVLIHGREAPVVGRICMNMFMVDVTHIPRAAMEDEVVLLGKQKKAEISADTLAELMGTINYEVTTRINHALPRVVV